MTPNTPPPDAVDQAFADFFRAQMPRPWPPAPVVSAAPAPRPATADPSRRARWTLAASVALLAGSCWLLSGGPQPGRRAGGNAAPGPGFLNESSATLPDAFKAKPKTGPAKATPAGEPGPFKLP